MINVQFVYGAGNDNWFGAALRGLQDRTKDKFGPTIYSPRILDWTELGTLIRLVGKWNDPMILVGHSCGCQSATQAAKSNSMKRIPFVMAIAPSMYCAPVSVAQNVAALCQASSWPLDMFNPFSRQLVSTTSANHKTQVSVIKTGLSHLAAPGAQVVQNRLWAEIQLAQKGA